MPSHPRKFISKIVMTLCAVACLSAAQVHTYSCAAASVRAQQSCLTTTFVYVLTKGGNFINVTKSLYTTQEHTYCVCEGQTLLIVLNCDAGTVRDGNGNLIGYTEEADTSDQTP